MQRQAESHISRPWETAHTLQHQQTAPPVTRGRNCHCLAATTLDNSRILLRPHSPTTAFHDEFDARIHRCFHLPDHWQAPVTTPAAIAVPVLALVFLSLLTSLADVTRRTLSSYVPGSRPGIVSGTILVPISASRTQKLWLTLRRKAFTVRHRLQ